MKRFGAILIVSLIVCYLATFFFAGVIMESFWGNVTIFAVLIAITATIFVNQQVRLEELEEKVATVTNHFDRRDE
ncbi:hypothetical protein [Alkalicoccus luteus]|uniref:hypothetical protein n=1 Tax=Alkalicoccus luteus TaxID=1237094 RepID=UPI00403366CE